MAEPTSHVTVVFDTEQEMTDRERAIAQFFARWARELPAGKAFQFSAEFIVLLRFLDENRRDA